MGFDPASVALIVGLAGAGVSAYAASRNKPPSAKPTSPAAVAATGEAETGKKRKEYKPVAQLFKEDLRLGMAGKLGL